MMKRFALALGDPCGIGPEVLLKTLLTRQDSKHNYLLYASEAVLAHWAAKLSLPKIWQMDCVELIGPDPVDIECLDPKNLTARARASLWSLHMAMEACLSGKAHGILTGPVEKSLINVLAPGFSGQTQELGRLAQVSTPVMVMFNEDMCFVPVTQHIPLRDVAQHLTTELIVNTVCTLVKSARSLLREELEPMVLCGLNPHAGELVAKAEEERVMQPAIDLLQKQGYQIVGPLPADSVFPRAREQGWKTVICSYHDQALIPAKYGGLDRVVNFTLGLPILRTSPGHGVAMDLAGRGVADCRSMNKALNILETGRLR